MVESFADLTRLPPPRAGERILFVTGKLAEPAVREATTALASRWNFVPSVVVVNVSVAALLHTALVLRRLAVPADVDRVILPGYCQGDLDELAAAWAIPVQRGPKDIFDLAAEWSGKREPADLSIYSVEILAEINHATLLTDAEVLHAAQAFATDGADVIDVGGVAGTSSPRLAELVRLLVGEGFRVSVDSFDRAEVEAAVAAGAELILSCQGGNRDWLAPLSVEVVAIPDQPHDLESLDVTVATLQAAGCPFRIDPILEPIGIGFAASLGRYLAARQRWPAVPMLMGIGNVTELTAVDSAGANMLLAGFCEEVEIGSVLTTAVINWCRTAVAEFDVARRLAAYARRQRTIPKHVDSRLVMLRDPRLKSLGETHLRQLAAEIRDPNFRIFAERDELHVMNRDGYWRSADPFELFSRLLSEVPIDAGHAFYLGYEFAKAHVALTLGKNYRQDEALRWGMLTVEEPQGWHVRSDREHRAP